VRISEGAREVRLPNPLFGIPDRWEHFATSHPLFLEWLPHLKEVMELAFTRQYTSSDREVAPRQPWGRFAEYSILSEKSGRGFASMRSCKTYN
jgi:hypothetical protein